MIDVEQSRVDCIVAVAAGIHDVQHLLVRGEQGVSHERDQMHDIAHAKDYFGGIVEVENASAVH